MECLGKSPPKLKCDETEDALHYCNCKAEEHYRKSLIEAADALEKDDHGADGVALVHCARGECSIVSEVIEKLRISAGVIK